ncbi:EAL domain-containing protein [Streptosporangium sp. NPDC051023]|uniref:putative bifunctional diguanylate cyclase/phosphodiesterase n=1 Tax=Streptosporangium sp. NPDC051023 TaxID=3155410 RepID=UPI003450EA7D
MSTIGLTTLAITLFRTDVTDFSHLLHAPLFWMLAGLIVLGELRPVVTPIAVGGTPTSTLFAFATLLYYGLSIAVLLQVAAVLFSGLVVRETWHRTIFNAAQLTLAFTAAAVTLGAFGVRAAPSHAWVPEGGHIGLVALAALMYFAITYTLACTAAALHERRSLPQVLKKTLAYQSLVQGTLLGFAPVVVVVMHNSPPFVLLFVAPLIAVHLTATLSVHRDHQATHDGLTGLPNRKLLMTRTQEALTEKTERVGLLLLDLDRFKEVNDTLGHPVGDRLLQIMAHRLTHSVRPGDVVARLGGDEFAVLLPSVRDADTAREVAARLRAALNEPVWLEGMSFDRDASIGIALHPDHAPDSELLLQRSDAAMYVAKEARTGVEMYQPDKDRNSPARLSLLDDLRRALAIGGDGELSLYYQPKVRLSDGRPVGMEALLRWHHPTHGLIPSEEFIPLAERSYLMHLLTQHVIDSALVQVARWWAAGQQVQVSVNVSARDLLDSGLPEVISAGMTRLGVPPHALQLEVTERILMTDQTHITEIVQTLADLGIPLTLDDFGSGYSSLVRLQRLPVEEVKIDASFVRRLTSSSEDAAIVRSIVDLVGSLGMRSVAKGVEDARTAALLREMGCDGAQGWLYGRPMSTDAAGAWLAERPAVSRQWSAANTEDLIRTSLSSEFP